MKTFSCSLSIRRFAFLAPIALCCFVLLTSTNTGRHNLRFKIYEDEENDEISETRDLHVKQAIRETFVWSSEIQGWTLSREVIGEKVANFKQQKEEEEVKKSICIWPEEECSSNRTSDSDRIVDQLKLINKQQDGELLFKILPPDPSLPIGQQVFIDDECLVNKCQITYDNVEADALIFKNADVLNEPPNWRRRHQIWIAYLLESPPNTFDKRFSRAHRGKHEFNWTASYRSDSDIVTPYSKFVPYLGQLGLFKLLKKIPSLPENIYSIQQAEQILANISYDIQSFYDKSSEYHKSLIASKQRAKVAWFVSNCNAPNGRLEYARELAKFIQVDIYGKCGNLTCHKWNQTSCLELINKEYKFYLAFENSNCPNYITEKLYANALGYNDLNYLVVPIVLGAPKSDYERLVPPASYIHVDDFGSPKELANYLKVLDSNDALYYSYFRWKTVGRFIESKFLCRVCAMLHESYSRGKRKSYQSIKDWWSSSSC